MSRLGLVSCFWMALAVSFCKIIRDSRSFRGGIFFWFQPVICLTWSRLFYELAYQKKKKTEGILGISY